MNPFIRTTTLALGAGAVLVFALFRPATANGDCTFSIATDAVKMEWTAFKFTDKTGVTGTFTKTTLAGPTSADSFTALATGLTMSIDAASIESNNPARNLTIREFFFEKFVPDPIIRGHATALRGDEKNGTIDIETTMNGVSRSVPFAYTIGADNAVEAKASIDMLDFKLEKAHASIHQTCEEQHRGPDGVSKTWTTVELALRGRFTKTCSPVAP